MNVASLVLGIVGLLAWIIPLFGYPITITGPVPWCQRQKDSRGAQYGDGGVCLSIIGLVLTVINSAYGAYLGATGQLCF